MLVNAYFVVTAMRFSLRIMPFKSVLDFVERHHRPALQRQRDEESVLAYQKRVLWAVRAVARRTLGDKPCLPQALAAKWFLARIGKESDLKIGVMKAGSDSLKAHAWLEVDQQIVIGGRKSPQYYKPLQSSDSSIA